MRDLAPGILRQRLLIEGYFTKAVGRASVESYLTGVAAALELKTYGPPIVHDPAGLGKPENQGYDAFIPLIDSGISLYVWSSPKFFAAVLFTCKRFDVERALDFTRAHFGANELAHGEF
jgi:S-adenosylmethionine decarboxylase